MQILCRKKLNFAILSTLQTNHRCISNLNLGTSNLNFGRLLLKNVVFFQKNALKFVYMD